jgi:hypothetical protein
MTELELMDEIARLEEENRVLKQRNEELIKDSENYTRLLSSYNTMEVGFKELLTRCNEVEKKSANRELELVAEVNELTIISDKLSKENSRYESLLRVVMSKLDTEYINKLDDAKRLEGLIIEMLSKSEKYKKDSGEIAKLSSMIKQSLTDEEA